MSVVCVYNDEAMLHDALLASLGDDERIERVLMDNRGGTHDGAGPALNAGAAKSRGDVIAFTHQDVFFLNQESLIDAAEYLRAHPHIGLLGAIGVTHDQALVGEIVDRVVTVGAPTSPYTPVDSVDELVFLVRRSTWRQHPITDDAPLRWHAYAVEYGLRLRQAGLEIGVFVLPVIHNSRSQNVLGLELSHKHLARLYADLLPVSTTTGPITPAKAGRLFHRGLRSALGRQWKRLRPEPVAVTDIREPDRILQRLNAASVQVVNRRMPEGYRAPPPETPIAVVRRNGIPFCFWGTGGPELPSRLDMWRKTGAVLVTNVKEPEIDELRTMMPYHVGEFGTTGFWAVFAPSDTQGSDRGQGFSIGS